MSPRMTRISKVNATDKVKLILQAEKLSKAHLKKVSKSPEIDKPALSLIKTPYNKTGKVSLKDLSPGSPILDTLFRDIRKVEIRLTPLKIKTKSGTKSEKWLEAFKGNGNYELEMGTGNWDNWNTSRHLNQGGAGRGETVDCQELKTRETRTLVTEDKAVKKTSEKIAFKSAKEAKGNKSDQGGQNIKDYAASGQNKRIKLVKKNTLTSEENSENSPVFTKLESVTSMVVKSYITGTPARTKPNRKFGTIIQPASLVEDSVVPARDTMDHKAVSSSTQVKNVLTGAEYSTEPHPLESVVATPTKLPAIPELRPPVPQMVTGKLANICSIM
eukprot:GFUD01121171.1.p1 GENE.GFUD01121171.1~~GFUD01121171.1.p1  ORF type:complete len:350 (-),score=110.45 GFUD01121171.1:39-1028(-)